MLYISKTVKSQLKDSLSKLAAHVQTTDADEEAVSMIILQIIRRYICCGFQCTKPLAPPTECDPLVEEAITALSQLDNNAMEGMLAYYVDHLLGLTLCTVYDQIFVCRSVGVLERVAQLLGHREYWGAEGVRQGRALGVLRCVESDLYKRAAFGLDNQYALARDKDTT